MSNDDTTRPQVGPKTPYLVYGTAWKEEKTGEFTETAFRHGFTGVDTANHPTAYNEPLTGDAIEAVLKSGVKRSDLFIQTKFTPLWAHDKSKIPFNPDQSLEGQIRQSIQQSFDHLKVDYLDAFMLHAPFQNENDNLVAWKVFETYVPDKIRCLGVSNFSLPQLKRIYENSTVKPLVVQNRFHRDTSYDMDLREYCGERGITYQAFWMLRHNPEILESELLSSVAEKFQVEKELAFYLLILGLGGTQVLNGTTKTERMDKDVKTVAQVFGDEGLRSDLESAVTKFRKLLQSLAEQKSAK